MTKFEEALEKEDEIDRITAKVFRDYIGFTQNRFDSATRQKKVEEYTNLLKNIKDDNLRCVIQNNLIVLSGNLDSTGGDYFKNLEEINDSKNKISLLQSVALRVNKITYLNKKNRVHDSIKLIHELEGQEVIQDNSEFIINKYFAHKKLKDFSTAEKYARQVMKDNLNLGFSLLVDLFLDINETKSIIDSLQSVQNNDHAKNFIFSLLIKDAELFSQYSNYLDELIKKSTDLKTLEVLLKLYESKQDKEKQVLVLNRIL